MQDTELEIQQGNEVEAAQTGMGKKMGCVKLTSRKLDYLEDHYHVLSLIALVVNYADITTDSLVAFGYVQDNHTVWATFSLIFILLPHLMIFFMVAFFGKSLWVKVAAFFPFLPIVNVYELFSGQNFTLDEAEIVKSFKPKRIWQRKYPFINYEYAQSQKLPEYLDFEYSLQQIGVKLVITGSKILEGVLESVPQSILQSYVLLNSKSYSQLQVFSISISFISLGLCALKVFQMFSDSELCPKPIQTLHLLICILPLYTFDCAARVLGLALIMWWLKILFWPAVVFLTLIEVACGMWFKYEFHADGNNVAKYGMFCVVMADALIDIGVAPRPLENTCRNSFIRILKVIRYVFYGLVYFACGIILDIFAPCRVSGTYRRNCHEFFGQRPYAYFDIKAILMTFLSYGSWSLLVMTYFLFHPLILFCLAVKSMGDDQSLVTEDLSVYPMLTVRILTNLFSGLVPLYFSTRVLVGEDEETRDILYRGVFITSGLCVIFAWLSARYVFNKMRKARWEKMQISGIVWCGGRDVKVEEKHEKGGEGIPELANKM